MTVRAGNRKSPLRLLWTISAANMQLTTDQPFVKRFSGLIWAATDIYVARVSGAFGVACVGGIYTNASKGGTAIVAATQVYSALTGANTTTVPPIAVPNPQQSPNLFLSLTTGNTGALTADFLIYGIVL